MVEIAHSTGTEFIIRLAELSCGKTAPCDTRLYGDPFTLLELSSLRIGGARQVERLFDSGTAICGAGVNNKDRTGDLMTCATPLDGMSGNRGREKPIFDFCAKSLVKRECASVGFALLSLSLHQRGPSISGVSLRMGLYNRSCVYREIYTALVMGVASYVCKSTGRAPRGSRTARTLGPGHHYARPLW